MTEQINIGFLVYPDVVQLDVMGAYQVLAFPPNVRMHLIWKTTDPITTSARVSLPSIVTKWR